MGRMKEGARLAKHRQSPAGNALPSPSIYTLNPSPSSFRSKSRRCALPKPLLSRPPSQRTISMRSFSAICRAPIISRLPVNPGSVSETEVGHARNDVESRPYQAIPCQGDQAASSSIAHLIRGGCERGPAFARGRDAAWIKDADASPGHGPVRGSSPTSPLPTRRTMLPGLHRNRSSISPSDRHGATASNQGQDHTHAFRFMKPLQPRPSHACSGVERHRPGFDSNS